MDIEFVTIYTTFPDEETARRICQELVGASLIACANLLPIQSIYKWEDAIENESEVAALLKTRAELIAVIESQLQVLHPYEVPAIVAWPIVSGNPAYLDWIEFATEEAAARLAAEWEDGASSEDKTQ